MLAVSQGNNKQAHKQEPIRMFVSCLGLHNTEGSLLFTHSCDAAASPASQGSSGCYDFAVYVDILLALLQTTLIQAQHACCRVLTA